MAKVPESRRVGRAAINAVRSLLERHGHIVHEIDGSNDFGEDLYVEFADDGRRTGRTVKIQVKGGNSYRSASGYRVPVGSHVEDWTLGNVPVLCIVYDHEVRTLHWINATKELLAQKSEEKRSKTLSISREAILDDQSIAEFVDTVGSFAARYQGNCAIYSRLAEMSGVEFGPHDRVEHFRNEFAEDLIFWQRPKEAFATLLHSDLDWEPHKITPEMFTVDKTEYLSPALVIDNIIIDLTEALWLEHALAPPPG